MRLDDGAAAAQLSVADTTAAQQAFEDGEGPRDDQADEEAVARRRVSAAEAGDVDAEVEEGPGVATSAFHFVRPAVWPTSDRWLAVLAAAYALAAAATAAQRSQVRIAHTSAAAVAHHAGQALVRAALRSLVLAAETAATVAEAPHSSATPWSVARGLQALELVRQTGLRRCGGLLARLLQACAPVEGDRQALTAVSLDGGCELGGCELLRDAGRAMLTRLSAEADAREMRRRRTDGEPSIAHIHRVDMARVSAGDAACDLQGEHIMRALLSGVAFGARRRIPITQDVIKAAYQRGLCPGLLAHYFLCDSSGAKALHQSVLGWQRAVDVQGMPRVVAVGQQILKLTWQAIGDLGMLRRYVEQHGADGTTRTELRRIIVRILELEGYSSCWALDRPLDADDSPFLQADQPGLDVDGVQLVSFSGDAASALLHELFNAWRDVAGSGVASAHRYAHAGPYGGTLGLRVSLRPSPLAVTLCHDTASGRHASGAEVLIRGAQAESRADMVALGLTRHKLGMGRLMQELVLPGLGEREPCRLLLDSAAPREARWFDITDVSTAA